MRTRVRAAAPTRTRTVRSRANKVSPKVTKRMEDDRAEFDNLLHTVGTLMAKQLTIAVDIEESSTRIEELMGELELTDEQNKKVRAYYKKVSPRSSTVYDVSAVFELLDEDEFFECVKISAVDVKKFLTGKDLEEVSETIAGSKKDPKFTLELRKEKK